MNTQNHHTNDLYYGLSAVLKNAIAPFRLRALVQPTEPVHADRLNLRSSLTTMFTGFAYDPNEVGKDPDLGKGFLTALFLDPETDLIRGYFNVIHTLENGSFDRHSSNIYERWLAFLQQHIEALKLDKQVAATTSNTTDTRKVRFQKNLKRSYTPAQGGMLASLLQFCFEQQEIVTTDPNEQLVFKRLDPKGFF